MSCLVRVGRVVGVGADEMIREQRAECERVPSRRGSAA